MEYRGVGVELVDRKTREDLTEMMFFEWKPERSVGASHAPICRAPEVQSSEVRGGLPVLGTAGGPRWWSGAGVVGEWERKEVRADSIGKGCAEHTWPWRSLSDFGFCSEWNGKALDVFWAEEGQDLIFNRTDHSGTDVLSLEWIRSYRRKMSSGRENGQRWENQESVVSWKQERSVSRRREHCQSL